MVYKLVIKYGSIFSKIEIKGPNYTRNTQNYLKRNISHVLQE